MQQKSITSAITSISASLSQKPTSHWMLLNDDLPRQDSYVSCVSKQQGLCA